MSRVVFVNPGTCGWTEIRQLVQELPAVQIVGEARSASETQRLAEELAPDFIVIPDRLNNESILPLLRSVLARCQPCRAVILTTGPEYGMNIESFRDLPLAGYLAWNSLPVDTFQAGLALAIGGTVAVYSVAILDRMLGRSGATRSATVHLTPREKTVLHLIADGYTDYLIAERVSLSVRSVERIVSDLKVKLHAAKRSDLCAHALRLGLLPDE